jgi:uncharacterized membrane protein YbaN (DUF454 family)
MVSLPRPIWLLLGWFFVGLGVLGIPLPLLPTTPFLLLASYCFSKGSVRWQQWLHSQPHLGPFIKDWEQHGVIRRRSKILCTVMVLAAISYPIFFLPIAVGIKILVVVTIAAVLTYIWTRPSTPRQR